MNHRLSALLIAAAAMGTTAGLPPLKLPKHRGSPPTGPRRVECPKCHAGVNEVCDRRTLGRHFFHKARLDAEGLIE